MDEETVTGLLQRMAAQKRDRKITLHENEETISATGEIVIRWGQMGKESDALWARILKKLRKK